MNKSSTINTKNKSKNCLSPLSITKPSKHTTEETTPTEYADNEFDWQIAERNKRIRSPNINSISPRLKKTNDSSNFISANRFSPIAPTEKDDMIFETSVESKDPPPPPPIFITSSINYVDLCNSIKLITKNEEFSCKSTMKNIKINLQSANSYRAVIKLFNENKLEYHTYQTREEKPYRVVIRNLHHTIPTDYIKDDIESNGFLVKNVTNILKAHSKEPLPLFFVDLNPSPNNQDIFKLKTICFTKIKIEAPHIRRDLVQCHRCQQYGHTKSYCNHHPKCVRCGENHSSDSCSKSKDLPAKCALCGNDHPANYRGCTVHKDLQRLRKKHQPNTISRVSAENSDSHFIPSCSQLPPGNLHPNNDPEISQIVPSDTQHLSFSQAVKGNKIKISKSNHTNDPTSDQLLTNHLTTFISEFKTLISPLITLLNPLISLLTSLINKLSSNNGI